MTVVVDASVALKWFIEEEGSQQAAALLELKDLLIAPDLIVPEVCNAAWKAVRTGSMLQSQQEHAARRLAVVLDELVPSALLAEQATAICRALDHPAYDCFYLALCKRLNTKLVTADRRLLRRVAATEWAPLVEDLRSRTA